MILKERTRCTEGKKRKSKKRGKEKGERVFCVGKIPRVKKALKSAGIEKEGNLEKKFGRGKEGHRGGKKNM